MNTLFFWPMLALVAVIAVVWVRMYILRVAEMRARRIGPQKLARSGPKSELLHNTNAADNFNNLFEVPVLFFVICVAIAASGEQSTLLLILAWTFVALRAIHSAIQTTYNRVMHRFPVYVVSTLVVFAMWIVFAARLARG